MDIQQNRKLLGNFLKSHRNRISPEQAGLPVGHTYRRTPGLRREEVAHLANVSITWYTWLEQGREVSASPEVLDSIGRVLDLTAAEREYMHKLAGRYVTQEQSTARHKLTPAFTQMVQDMPYPCVALGAQNELIAWNDLACKILIDFSLLPAEERIMLRLNFLNAELRSKIVNWEQANQISLAFFRKLYAPYSNQEWHIRLVDELITGSKEFSEWWVKHEVAEKNGLQVEIRHPVAGHMHFEIITFNQINDLEGTMCCLYAPLPGSGTAEKLLQIQSKSLK
ncbi:helix-turn-helix transcriptional regulator [Paenibacillus sp. KQZ6P-2]|uniref:Helix-turn-helix transcriptional regulator n=1 Tax=Paenibacillus mangrovi TaxID=2931978 RepID=A0A9X2B4M7_9BACL|nr:helix-turn-helix transcriptional regulator [Paenibacillus mangrovi]MCJ8014130.1 helix-turn-helix transcriptional regulator [Paenibacillus mangrovi]